MGAFGEGNGFLNRFIIMNSNDWLEVCSLHQAEKYVKQIVEELGKSSYMQEFLKQGKDKKAIEDVAGKLKQFSENMSVLQPIAIKGFMVPSGSLMLFRYLQEELEAVEAMLQSEPESKPVAAPGPDEKTQNMKEAGTTGRERANAGKTQPAAGNAADVLPPEQKEELQKRVGIIRHRLLEMMESLLSQHIADQIEQRTDEKAAQEAFQQNGYLPLYVDEKAMGIVYNTLTVQLLLDRFNLLFEGVFAPVDQETVNSVMVNVLAPYWKQNAQSILFTMEE